MPRIKVGDHVTWKLEAGYVSGKITKVRTKDVDYRGYRKIVIVCSLILVILACSRSLKQAGERTGPIDYGPFPTTYEQIIKDVINPSLSEPSSAIYNLSIPQKGRNTMNGERGSRVEHLRHSKFQKPIRRIRRASAHICHDQRR